MIDSNQFSKAVMPHSRKMFAVAYRFMQRSDEAEDIVQDVLVKLWQMREKLPPGEQLAPFLLTVTRNLCIDRLRARKEDDNEDIDLIASQGAEEAVLDTRVDDHDRLQRLMKLMGQLPPDQQKVLRLRAFDDLPTEQIAELLNLRTDNVRQLLSRARRQLKELATKQGIL